MSFALIVTTLLISILVKPVISGDTSDPSIFEEFYFDQRLSQTGEVPEENSIGTTALSTMATKTMTPPLIEKCIEFLKNRKNGLVQANNRVSNNFKDHGKLSDWLKAASPNMIDGIIKVLKGAKSIASGFDSTDEDSFNFGNVHYESLKVINGNEYSDS